MTDVLDAWDTTMAVLLQLSDLDNRRNQWGDNKKINNLKNLSVFFIKKMKKKTNKIQQKTMKNHKQLENVKLCLFFYSTDFFLLQ